jgi:hypothetical protein
MKRAFTILDQYEKRIDLEMGRARFISWIERLEQQYSPEQVDAIVSALQREALSAEKPAAFTMWAVKGPIGAWLTDYAYDKIKRIGKRQKGSGTETIQSVLRRSRSGAL